MSSSGSVFAERILTNDFLFQVIFDASSPKTLLRLSRTCRRAHTAVTWYIPRRFDVNHCLSPYFSDHLAFRSLQARTGTLISGSTALQFFAEQPEPDANLDLCVPQKHKETLCRFLVTDGYTYRPSFMQEPEFEKAITKNVQWGSAVPYGMKGVEDIWTFIKETKNTRSTAKNTGAGSSPGVAVNEGGINTSTSDAKQIHVIVAKNAPMEVILRFHSTVVMNVIAWDRAYCLYPRGTLVDRTSLYTRSFNWNDWDVITKCTSKYERRGWEFIFEYDLLLGLPSWIPFAPRWIGDGHSWVVKLSTTGVTPPPPINDQSQALTRDPCVGTTWKLSFVQELPTPDASNIDPSNEEEEEGQHISITFGVAKSDHLDYTYVTCAVDPTGGNFLKEAMLAVLRQQMKRRNQQRVRLLRPAKFDEDLMQYITAHLEEKQQWSQWTTA